MPAALSSVYPMAIALASVVNTQHAGAPSLVPWTFAPLPLGSIQPEGWLRNELQISASGLAGHEADFYPYVNDSHWVHSPGSGEGSDYSDLNEAFPYWLNGLVPLAYSLGDQRLKGQVQKAVDTVLGFQAPDGWLGPEVGSSRNLWARTPLLLALTQLADADASYQGRVVQSMRSFLNLTHSMLSNNSQGFTNCGTAIDCSWGQVRYHDLIISIQWLLERHPNATSDPLLWDTMNMLYNQTLFRWDEWYVNGVYQQVISDPTTNNPKFAFLHGVNVGQGLKALAVIRRFTHNDSLVQTTQNAVDWTFQYHGAPSGTVLADEIMRDLASYSGSELCTAVETAYSLEYLYHSLGVNEYADRAERTVFNALPVMLTGDHWAHQYMDQPNGPWTNNSAVGPNNPAVFTTSQFGVATTFGMEPQYPCCTVNHPQGYPKFLSNSWATLGDNGLVHALLSPSTVTLKLKYGTATVTCTTDYPFANSLVYTINSTGPFDLYLRNPKWAATGSNIKLDGFHLNGLSPDSQSGLIKLSISRGKHLVVNQIEANVRTEARSNGAVSVFVGNVLYALDVDPVSNVSSLPHHYYDAGGDPIPNLPANARDYYIQGEGAWAVAIDTSTLVYHGPQSSPASPFVPGTDAGHVSVMGCQIAWGIHSGATPDIPPTNATCTSEPASFTLLPYGQSKVHMAELPVVSLGASDEKRSLTSQGTTGFRSHGRSIPVRLPVPASETNPNTVGYMMVQ